MSKDTNSYQPKVAIIVPIYNVEKYLKDCLDSLINQTYKNLEIILVDDGSTDKSTDIAKAYFEKDYRITLICKSNGGQGSARNAGIEYVSNGFVLTPLFEPKCTALDTVDSINPTYTTFDYQSMPFTFQATLKPNALSANHIDYLTGETFSFASSYVAMGGGYKLNSLSKPLDYSIYSCIIFSHSPTPPKQVEYIHFVDSDDMLSVDCIEQCIENIGECDIIWHDTKYIYEDGIPKEQHTPLLQSLHLTQKQAQNGSFNALELWKYTHSFSWVHQGLFKFSMLENLRFSTPLANEDALFGMLLFARAKNIKITSFYGLIYRYHTASVSAHGESQNIYRKTYPLFMSSIVMAFQNGYKIKHYYFAYSCTYICLGLLAYIETLDDSQLALKNKLIEFLQVRAVYAFGAMSFESDPKYVRPLLKPLEPYMQKVGKANKIAYFTPKIYKILKWLNGKRRGLRLGKIQNS